MTLHSFTTMFITSLFLIMSFANQPKVAFATSCATQQSNFDSNPLTADVKTVYITILECQYIPFLNQTVKLNEACKEAELVFANTDQKINPYINQIRNHIFRKHDKLTLKVNVIYALEWYDRLIKKINTTEQSMCLTHIREALNAIQQIVDSL